MKPRGAIFLGVASTVLVGLAIVGATRAFDSGSKEELRSQFERAQGLGLPNTLSDLWPPPSDPAQNAAPYYTALGSSHGLRQATEVFDKIGHPIDAVQVRTLRKSLAPYESALNDFERISVYPECRFVRTPSITVPLPEYNTFRFGVNALAGRARLEAAEGDPMKAMRTLDAAARITAHAGSEPIFAAKYTAASAQAATLRAAQIVLGKFGHRAEVRAAARKLLVSLGPVPLPKDAMQGEWAFEKGTMDAIASGKLTAEDVVRLTSSSGPSASGTPTGLKLASLSLRTPAGLAGQSATAVRLFLDYYEALPADPGDLARARAATSVLRRKLDGMGPDALLANILMADFQPLSDASARIVAERRTFTALLNALDAPTPPTGLPLKGKEAIDPFSGKPLLYRAASGEIRIWSVGVNGKDDGGLPKRAGGQDDIAALWPFPQFPTEVRP